MQKLSVVIITRNEERNIGRCLSSIKPVADDIVVVDSHSTDATTRIAQQYAVRLFQKDWEGYSATKNFGNLQAHYDWILSMDADEALSAPLMQSILTIKGSLSSPAPFKINRITNYCGKWIKYGGWNPDIKVRFFDRRVSKWEGSVHEKLTHINESKIELLEGDLLHYTYYSIEEHKKRFEIYSELAAESLWKEGKRAGLTKRFLSPVVKFAGDYFFKLGFLDGYYGFHVARISALATYAKYKKLKEKSNRK